MKKITLALATALLSFAASAQTLVLEPKEKPLDPALLQLGERAPSALEIRELDIAGARKLLASTEGPVWRVLAVEAPACSTAPLPKEKAERKEARTLCKEQKLACKAAESFAVEHASHVACSELYTQTTVLLANDGNGKKVKAKTAEKRIKAKTNHRAKKVRKPQAGSC